MYYSQIIVTLILEPNVTGNKTWYDTQAVICIEHTAGAFFFFLASFVI